DYDAGSDTCSVSLDQLGLLSAWLTVIAVAREINRSQLIAGARGTILLTDPHSLCSATLISILLPQGVTHLSSAQSGVQRQQAGRVAVPLNSQGSAQGTIAFPLNFSAAPSVLAAADRLLGLEITSAGNGNFGYSITGGTPLGTVHVSWGAEGNT
ncbi:MAG: hypothetical protein ACRDZ5_12530, partial [Acidimicrobiales bacterium]